MGLAELFGGGESSEEEKNRKLAISAFTDLKIPKPEEMYAQIQQLVQQGQLQPADIPLYVLGPTAYQQIKDDPQSYQAEFGALDKLENITKAGGMTATDKARTSDILDQLNTAERGNREAISESAKAKGIGGSAYDLLSQQLAGQGTAEAANKAGTQVAADAEQRALEAIGAQGQLGQQLNTQVYGKEANKATAADAIAAFNAQNSQNVAGANTGASNAAQAANLAEKQRISDTNVGNANTEAIRRAELPKDIYNMGASRAAGISGAAGEAANAAAARSNQNAALTGGLISAGIGAGGQIGAAAMKPKAGPVPAEKGAVVTKPTLILAGEKNKTEYVVPKDKLENASPEMKQAAMEAALESLSGRVDRLEGC